MSEAPRWGGGGLCSNRLDEFWMTGTADALNRPEVHVMGTRSIATDVPPDIEGPTPRDGHDHLDGRVGSIVPPQPEQLEHP